MKTISAVLEPLYRKYAVALHARRIQLDLNIQNPQYEVEHPQKLSKLITEYIDSTLDKRRHLGDKITIASMTNSDNKYILIRDETQLLSPEGVEHFQSDNVEIRTRVGFGTFLKIKL